MALKWNYKNNVIDKVCKYSLANDNVITQHSPGQVFRKNVRKYDDIDGKMTENTFK